MATAPTPIGATTPLPLPPPFSNSDLHLLTQGAEALVFRTTLLSPNTPVALKYRPPKPYRHPVLDKRLTKQRLLAEARVLVKCAREGVAVPAVVALSGEEGWLGLGWVEGGTVRGVLDEWVGKVGLGTEEEEEAAAQKEEGERKVEEQEKARRELWELMGRVGRAVGRMHEIGVCHGDLTTSNLMLRPSKPQLSRGEELGEEQFSAQNVEASLALGRGTVSAQRESALNAESTTQPLEVPGEVPDLPTSDLTSLAGDIVLIDFGLATQSSADEDRAVDLYVLERAFAATHPVAEPLFQEVLRVYGDSYKGAKVVLRRLEDVRMRGRKRSMLG
jgi:TP53 regulating kinase-like protein